MTRAGCNLVSSSLTAATWPGLHERSRVGVMGQDAPRNIDNLPMFGQDSKR